MYEKITSFLKNSIYPYLNDYPEYIVTLENHFSKIEKISLKKYNEILLKIDTIQQENTVHQALLDCARGIGEDYEETKDIIIDNYFKTMEKFVLLIAEFAIYYSEKKKRIKDLKKLEQQNIIF